MRWTILNGIGLLFMFLWMSSPVSAVTVNIDVVSKGEPVPSTEISFETADGSAVKLETPPAETTAELVPEDGPDSSPGTPSDSGTEVPTDASKTPPSNETSTTAATKEPSSTQQTTTDTSSGNEPQGQTNLPDEEESASNSQRIVIPDEFIGKTLTMIIKKDGEVIKRQPLPVEPKEQQVPVEAFDVGDARISVSVTQAKPCRRGKSCDIYFDATNQGEGIYKGPLFLAANVQGTLARRGTGKDDLTCGPGAAGQYLCQALVSLEPNETQRWTMRFSLPAKLARNASNCVEVLIPDPGKQEGQGSLVQAVQLGLLKKNLLQGRADGRLGPKTMAAIAKFTNSNVAQPDFLQLYEAIYVQDAQDAVRLGLGNVKACQALKTLPEPVVKKKVAPSAKSKSVATQKSKTQKTQQAKSTKRQADDDDDDDEGDFNPVGVGISIGLGSGLGGSKNHHRKKKKYEDLPID